MCQSAACTQTLSNDVTDIHILNAKPESEIQKLAESDDGWQPIKERLSCPNCGCVFDTPGS